jgi:hypothetical protein
VIWAVLIIAAIAAVGFGAALAVKGRRDYRDQHGVVPGVESHAPESWAGSHTPEAKLHRRLRAAVDAATGIPNASALGLAPAIAGVEREALAIDTRLVSAAGLPERHRADAVAEVAPLVDALEDTTATLVAGISIESSMEVVDRVLSEAHVRLQAIAQARAEVERIDRDQTGGTTATG